MRFALLLLASLLSWNVASATAVRARWVNSQELWIKLAQNIPMSSEMSFSLTAGTNSNLQKTATINLPIVRSENNYVLLSTADLDRKMISDLLRSSLKLVITDRDGHVVDTSAIQYSGILDELYAYKGNDLGVRFSTNEMSVKLWTPTARNVRLFVYETADQVDGMPTETLGMTLQDGVWSALLSDGYKNKYYLYEVTVYYPISDRTESFLVTDPYSFSLSANGSKSQFMDPQDEALKPSGWDNLRKPGLKSFKDIVIYEMHIRDFSANDPTVPFMYRGTYNAFSQGNSKSVQHLKSLADAGLTYIHLLPFNDFGSVNEDKSKWQELSTENNGGLEVPQRELGKIRKKDSFNWGYDPVHYFVPEGSYATNANGATRVLETRQMVKALNGMGLRVVQDVVFNHTYTNSIENYSVFDKIVPLYYYRTDDEGNVKTSSCCFDTASERYMMEKLMIDSIVYWAKTYKIDSFRFDLMSFHSRSTMERVKKAVNALTLAKDGVDGSKIYLYGEGWSFGSYWEQNPREAMTQDNSYGAGIGLFNDRIRDAVRGGTTNSWEKSDQGFATGLYFDFNGDPANRNTPMTPGEQRGKLLHLGDVIKVGLTGNLRDYNFREHLGTVINSGSLLYRGNQVGNAAQAIETVNYVSAHDGYTLWDAIQAKAPFISPSRVPMRASSEERQRMMQMALAIPMLGQGIPFIEGGSEVLRSKNGDQDSYDSGDYFNRVDWSLNKNYWGEALPPSWKNLDDWSFWFPRLQAPDMQVSAALIERNSEYFKALLRLRQSSELFKMNTADEIRRQLHFIDNDNGQEVGLIAMLLENNRESILVFFNSSKDLRTFKHPVLSLGWDLAPEFNSDIDKALRDVRLSANLSEVQLPGMSTVVLRRKIH